MNAVKRVGLFGGPVLFAATLLYPTLFALPEGMTPEMIKMLAVVILMAIWWMTEALPIPVTALLPIALFPTLGIMKSAETTPSYANHIIYLFIGGFFMAVAMEKWNLHKRIAMHTIRLVGDGPERVILGFMLATGFLSMWVSNTATAMMMVPVGMAVITQVVNLLKEKGSEVDPENFKFGTALMLGIAYAASIGGVATLIGTPPNTVLAGIVEKQYGQTITFASWMAFGLPLSVTFLLITWFLLVKVMLRPEIDKLPGGMELINNELKKLGPMSRQEKQVLAIFGTVAVAWIALGFLKLPLITDATISILGALAMFIVPTNFQKNEFLLDWKSAAKIPWGVVILFGGGLALTDGVSKVALDTWVTGQLTVLSGMAVIVLLAVIVFIAIFLTEVTSNTATATLLIPAVGSLAIAMGIHPYGPMIAACVACSYAFMLPVATPPNAVVFGSGYVTIPQMSRVGFILNLAGIVVVTLTVMYFLQAAWSIDLATLPDWALPLAAAK
ncbi:MAG TPA: DASS family sodium-coupled anion symporter [Anaerolineae bacterium]|nr:DASS family sodium-coupled anion symporter [Anaerolineae bacterium]